MPAIGRTFVDLIDVYKSMDGMGRMATVVEMLTELNPQLDDAVAVECNKGTTHQHSIRTQLPSVVWGELYRGIPQSKSGKAQVEDTTGFVQGLSTIDERLLKLNSAHRKEIRLSEATAFLESIAQDVGTQMWYGSDANDPRKFMGFSGRFSDKSAANGKQIIDAGGTGSDNASIWFVTWGENQCHTLYPKGMAAGVESEDMGRQRVLDEDGNPFYAYEEMFTQHMGLSVRDPRYVARIANIDVSDLEAGSVDLYKFMRKAYYQLHGKRQIKNGLQPTPQIGRQVIYCNRTIKEALDGLSTNNGASDNYVRLKPMEVEGKEVDTYRGIPIRETDSLLSTEAQVT